MKDLQLVIILLLVSLGTLFGKLTTETPAIRSTIVPKCLLYLIKTYFYMSRKVSLRLATNHEQEDWLYVIERLTVPIVINADEIPKARGIDKRAPNDVVFILDESYNITKGLNRTLWTADTIFVAALYDSSNVQNKLLNIFNQFFTNNVVNVMVLIENESQVDIYSFKPFTSCGGQVDNIESLGVCTSQNFQDKGIEHFMNNQGVRDLNGCPVNVTVVDLPPTVIFPDIKKKNGTSVVDGVEARELMEISKKMNFTPHFAVARDGQAWGWIEPEPHGVVGEVFTGHSQFGFGLLASTLERYEYLDVSVPTSSVLECITWAVPIGAGKRQETWINILINEFPGRVWTYILITIIVTTVTIRLLVKYSFIELMQFQGNAHAVFYMISSTLGVPVKIPYSPALRSLFLAWIWYSFILVTAYQSAMGSKLTVPAAQPDVNTFRDLIESNLHLTGFYNTFRLVQYGDQDADIQIIARRLEATEYGIAEAVRRIVTDRNIAYMRESTTFLYNAMINPLAKGQVHIMKQCVYMYYPTMVLQKRCPYTKRVNGIIRQLSEGGIIAQWRSRYLYDVPLTPPSVIELSLKHLTGPFIVLCAGHGMSIAVFSGELIYNYHISKHSERILKQEVGIQ